MSLDVKGTLETFVKNNAIAITSDIKTQFGDAIGTAIDQLFSGSINIGGGFTLTGDASSATITGTGTGAPLLSGYQVTAVFASSDGTNVTLTFNAKIVADIPVSDAWPALLNTYPFTKLIFTGGSLSLTVDPGDQSYKLKIVPSIQFEGDGLSATGLLELQYVKSKLGFLGGAVVTGSWTPFADFPVLSSITLSGEIGAFFSTITETDLSDFSTFPFVPSQVTPGLTVFTQMTMGGDLAKIAKFIVGNASLDLTAIIPQDGGLDKASVSAALANTSSPGDFEISTFSLTWQSTSATSGTIDLDIEAIITISSSQTLDVIGDGTFTYGDDPALTATLTLTGNDGKGWVDPFGIPNLTIVDIIFALSLAAEDGGITIGLSGTIDVGSGDNAVALSAAAVFDDFEVPIFVSAALSSVDAGKSVTLAQLIDAFIPELNLGGFPLLSNISFTDLSFYACAAPTTIGSKTYQPGIGATGDIDFFGYDLDFAFCLITQPKTSVQAKGSISHNGGPIVISGAGINWITIGGANGASFPSACIDTTASGYCTCSGNVTNAYFCIQGSLSILGLVNLSVSAAASSSMFEFDVDLSVGDNVFSDKLHVFLDLDKSVFAASSDLGFNPPSITLGPWGVIPQFTISGPSISVCLALGTTMPSSPPCGDGWMPSSAQFFHFDIAFSWGAIDFNIPVDLDINAAVSVFSDFGKFIVNWILNNAEAMLNFVVQIAKEIAKALIQLGYAIADVAQAIVTQLGEAFDDAYAIASEVWDDISKICSSTTAYDAMTPAAQTDTNIAPPFTPTPELLAELAAAPGAHAVLHHYYVHRDEANTLLLTNAEIMTRAREQIATHRASADYERDVHLPLVIDLITTTATAGSPAYKAAAEEVIAAFEPYRDRNYGQILEIIHAG
jgi:hypothetical protein